MEAFLNKPNTLAQIKEALSKGNIYRKSGKEVLPKLSLTKALNIHVTWTSDPDHRRLTFLCRFPKHFVALSTNDAFIAKVHNKLPTLEHGYIEPRAAYRSIEIMGHRYVC